MTRNIDKSPVAGKLSERQLKRFWARVIKTKSCWNWIGFIDNRKRGRIGFVIAGVNNYYRPYRVVYELLVGPIPPGLVICHKCDNPICLNPDHLFAGTQKDNIHDAIMKNRFARGEKHGQSKLTKSQVTQIRKLDRGPWGRPRRSDIAAKFGISAKQVERICNMKLWKIQ